MPVNLKFVWYNNYMCISIDHSHDKWRIKRFCVFALLLVLLFLCSHPVNAAFDVQVFSFQNENKLLMDMRSAFLGSTIETRKNQPERTGGKPIGYIDLEDGYAVIDINDNVLGIMIGEPPDHIPLFKGLQIRSLVQGEPLEEKNKQQFHTCIAILNAVLNADQQDAQKTGFVMVQQVKDIRYIDEWTQLLTISLEEEQRLFTVRISDMDRIQEDMAWLRFAVEQNMFQNAKDGVLHISEGNPTFRKMSTLREK